MRRMLTSEIPLSLARFRDAVPTFGVTPYIIDEQKCLILEHHYWEPDTRKSLVKAKAIKSGTFIIILDVTRMYPSGERVQQASSVTTISLTLPSFRPH